MAAQEWPGCSKLPPVVHRAPVAVQAAPNRLGVDARGTVAATTTTIAMAATADTLNSNRLAMPTPVTSGYSNDEMDHCSETVCRCFSSCSR